MTDIIEVREIKRRLESSRIKDPGEWKGKTVTGVVFDDYSAWSLLAFSDSTWSVVGIDRGHESGDESISLHREFYPVDSMAEFLELSLVTEEEVEIVSTYKQSVRESLNRQRDLAQLERLKAKYGKVE